MLFYYTLFFFVAFGAKAVLALVTIYLLLPTDRRCNGCDSDTLLLRSGRPGRIVARLFLGRVQRRWCPRCGWEGLARTGRGRPDRRARAAARITTPTNTS